MLIEEQIAERQLRARKETFKIEPQGRGVFDDYKVFSPASKRSYRVALRCDGLFDNYGGVKHQGQTFTSGLSCFLKR